MTLLERNEVIRLRGGELADGVEHREPRLRVVAGVWPDHLDRPVAEELHTLSSGDRADDGT